MKTILMSIRPEWVQKILSGEKTLEIRKTMPKRELPFKALMYCTKHRHFALVQGGGKTSLFYACNPYTAFIVGGELANGKVVGEFICDRIITGKLTVEEFGSTCLTKEQFMKYMGNSALYALHITAVKAYDKPKELGEYGLTRPPQSWQYVEEDK